MTEYTIALNPTSEESHVDIKQCLHTSSTRTLPEFLTAYPKMPYTTFRTMKSGTAVPQLDFHIQRLLHGASFLCPTSSINGRHLRVALIRLLNALQAESGAVTDLQVVTALVASDTPTSTSKTECHVHVTGIPDAMRVRNLRVECRGAPREMPSVKNTAWYSERKPLEVARDARAEETILLARDREGFYTLQEGLVTNIFFITKGGQIWTASEHTVLAGSMRSCVMDACKILQVDVEEGEVRLKDYGQFDTAFLTNALKMLVPVSSMIVPEEIGAQVPSEIHFPSGQGAQELLIKLRSTVCQLLESSAVALVA